ncbi:dCTP deaminase [Halochromatium salexigens]|uniref:dCTP deaminase n=1 Tax=Halochromatium salexigens TaxID=49447 RepID=A0AAJ0UG85_HALSE|nr:dCTP deaminase [Halochromatium salexigens]
MSIKSDRWIRRMAREQGMIEPYIPGQVRESESGGRVISYGTSSYGYDIRCADEFKIFTNINSAVVDPKNFDSSSFVNLKSDVCIIPPNSFALARTVEYFRIPRNVLTICLGKSTYARCFRGDTRVALLDGSTPTLEEMARRAEQGELFWGYSIGQYGRVIAALLEAPRYIGRDALLELTLDNGQQIHCTPDHEFVLRDGRMLAANELRPNDSLMPLYRHLARGCEMAYQPSNGHLYPTHRLADEWNLRNGLDEAVPGTHRHHKDCDRLSSLPGTVERLAASERIRLHNAERLQPASALPAFREKGQSAVVYNHKIQRIREIKGDHDVYCLTVPEAGNFALAAGVFVSNCGIIVNVTPLEPEWEGHVTLEFSNTTPLPAKVYANEGVAQILFLESNEVCETSYKDRGGKYQGQRGVTLPRS